MTRSEPHLAANHLGMHMSNTLRLTFEPDLTHFAKVHLVSRRSQIL